MKIISISCNCGFNKEIRQDNKYYKDYLEAIKNKSLFICDGKKCDKLLKPIMVIK